MKCFVVRVELEALVFAETADAARRAGRDSIRDEGRGISEHDLEAEPATYVPFGYELDDELDAGVTVAEALSQTPEYQRAMARHRRSVE